MQILLLCEHTICDLTSIIFLAQKTKNVFGLIKSSHDSYEILALIYWWIDQIKMGAGTFSIVSSVNNFVAGKQCSKFHDYRVIFNNTLIH